MAKDKHSEVRAHSQEKEWLLNLGNGNIVEAAQNLIRQIMTDQAAKQGKSRPADKTKK